MMILEFKKSNNYISADINLLSTTHNTHICFNKYDQEMLETLIFCNSISCHLSSTMN